tara:strand:- start:802 stop:2088 length:1287 start_codon:yes stop_codon:yes gene_type:complete
MQKIYPLLISFAYVVFIKLFSTFLKGYFIDSNFLINIGTANGIFRKAASNFDVFLDYSILFLYGVLLYFLYKNEEVLKVTKTKNIIYILTFIFVSLNITTLIVFQEYRGWDLSLYCVTDVSSSLQDSSINIYDYEYQKIKPGLSPIVWLIYNKFCNLQLFGFSYFNNYFWLQMFVGTALVGKYLNFSYFESLILSTGLNLSLLDMIRTGNYGYIMGIIMVICLKNLLERKNETFNIILLSIVTFLKIQYILIIALYFMFNKFSFKKLINYFTKFLFVYLFFYVFQYFYYKKAFLDYVSLLFGGYLTNELTWESGITNPVASQFISRVSTLELNLSFYILLVTVIFGIVLLSKANSRLLLTTSLFNRNKSYDSNYLLLTVEKKYVTEFIFAFCFIPNILFCFGSLFSLGPISELLYIPSLIYVVFMSNK